jgi:hypothetical protein
MHLIPILKKRIEINLSLFMRLTTSEGIVKGRWEMGDGRLF